MSSKFIALGVLIAGVILASAIIFIGHQPQTNPLPQEATTTFQGALQQAEARISPISLTLSSTDYQNTDPPFEIIVPAGFVYVSGSKVSEPKQFAVAIRNSAAPKEDAPGIGVRITNTSATLDAEHDEQVSFFKRAGASIYSDTRTVINGIPAWLTVMVVPTPVGVPVLKQMDARLVANGEFYLVQGVATPADWDKYAAKFENSIRSFTIK